MKTKIVYTDPYSSEMFIQLNEFREANGDEDSGFISVPVREWVVRTKDGNSVHRFRSRNPYAKGREKTLCEQRELDDAKNWLHKFSLGAKYHSKPMRCDNLDGNGLMCPYVKLDNQNKARCWIRPSHYGYSGGGEVDGLRELPADRLCNLPQDCANHFREPIKGDVFSLWDYYRVDRGIAKKQIEKENVKC